MPDSTRSDHDSGSDADARPRVLLSGWGPADARLAADLRGHGIPLVVVTLSPDGAAEAERFGHPVVRGDSAKQAVLRHAGLADVDVVVIPEDEPEHASRIAAIARELNPAAQLVVRPVGAAELDALAAAGVDKVVDSARTSSDALSASVLAELDETAGRGVDTTRIVRFTPRPHDGCPHTETIQPVLPSARGCEECLRTGDRWVHLRVCLGCGFVGCCGSSPHRHARGHGQDTGHPLIASLQDGETWAYCYLDGTTLEGRGSDGAHER